MAWSRTNEECAFGTGCLQSLHNVIPVHIFIIIVRTIQYLRNVHVDIWAIILSIISEYRIFEADFAETYESKCHGFRNCALGIDSS